MNLSSPRIEGNLFADNPCRAINMTLLEVAQPNVLNNTIVRNRTGIRVDARVPTAQQIYANNLLYGNETGLEVEFDSGTNGPTWTHNLVFGNTTNYVGIADRTGTDGNLSADPLLACPENGSGRPGAGSPAIDAGDPAIPGVTAIDLVGENRILDGDGDGSAVVDIGAFEFSATAPPQSCLSLTCPQDVTKDGKPGEPGVAVVYPDPTVSPGATVECSPASGSVFAVGTSTVTCVARDASGGEATCSFSVTVARHVPRQRGTEGGDVAVPYYDVPDRGVSWRSPPALVWAPTRSAPRSARAGWVRSIALATRASSARR